MLREIQFRRMMANGAVMWIICSCMSWVQHLYGRVNVMVIKFLATLVEKQKLMGVPRIERGTFRTANYNFSLLLSQLSYTPLEYLATSSHHILAISHR